MMGTGAYGLQVDLGKFCGSNLAIPQRDLLQKNGSYSLPRALAKFNQFNWQTLLSMLSFLLTFFSLRLYSFQSRVPGCHSCQDNLENRAMAELME